MAKADNLLAVLWLLRRRQRMTAAEIAAELETSVRTVYRYIDALCASGVPVVAEAGPEGGYRLAEGFKGAPLFFDPTELVALFQAARFAQASGHPYSEALESALAKVKHMLLPQQVEELQRRVSSLLVGGVRQEADRGFLADLEQAVAQGTTVDMEYHKPASDVPELRRVDPYGLSYQNGLWMLVAWCHLRQDLRTFRVDRIRSLRPTNEHFERLANFDLEGHFGGEMPAILEQIRTGPHTTVRITGEPQAIAALGEHWYLRHCLVRRAPREAEFAVDPVGMAHMPRQLLHAGTAITVVEPPELKQMVADQASQWATHHSSLDPGRNPSSG